MSTKRTSTHRRGERKRAGVPPPPALQGPSLQQRVGAGRHGGEGMCTKQWGGMG